MAPSEQPPPKNGFVRAMRKVYNPLGFSKGYNALLWFVFDGAMLGFVLARFQYLNIWGVFCPDNGGSALSSAAPGECYWYRTFPRNKIGIILHLGTILPAAFLVVFQFIPIIRYKAILYHRIAGYAIFLLVVVSDIGAIMVANHAFGGDISTQMFIGFLVLVTTIALVLAYVNIKRLQIDQHRAWMLRAWFYFASIITLRIISIIAIQIESKWPGYSLYAIQDCNNMLFEYARRGLTSATLYTDYPACDPMNSQWAPGGMVIVKATFKATNVMEIGSALDVNFGASGWLALALHAIGIEIYLRLTPKESSRLRKLSYERQLEAGFKNPGSSGLVVERFGDADPWTADHVEPKSLQRLTSSSDEISQQRVRRDSGRAGIE